MTPRNAANPQKIDDHRRTCLPRAKRSTVTGSNAKDDQDAQFLSGERQGQVFL